MTLSLAYKFYLGKFKEYINFYLDDPVNFQQIGEFDQYIDRHSGLEDFVYNFPLLYNRREETAHKFRVRFRVSETEILEDKLIYIHKLSIVIYEILSSYNNNFANRICQYYGNLRCIELANKLDIAIRETEKLLIVVLD